MRCTGCMEEIGSGQICPFCDFKAGASVNAGYLKPGAEISARYKVGNLLKTNGECGEYIGWDNNLQCKVIIREYFPTTLALRNSLTGAVVAKEGCGAQYKALLSDYAEIAATINRLSSRVSVVPVESVIEANNTVYAIYSYMELVDLETWLRSYGKRIAPQQAVNFFLPLFNTVDNIHSMGLIHRGISPLTVFVDANNKLFLDNFAIPSARTCGEELEYEIFNGYAAPEQYATNGWQGSWTDVYGLAAVFYRVVSGSVPPKATLINAGRPLTALSELVEEVPPTISSAIENAMSFDWEERTQTAANLIASITCKPNTDISGNTAVYDTTMLNSGKKGKEAAATEDDDEDYKSGGTFKFLAISTLATIAIVIVFMFYVVSKMMPGFGENSSSKPGSSVPPPSSSESQWQPSSSSSSSQEESSKVEDKTVPRFVGQKQSDVEKNADYEERFSFQIKSEFNSSYEEGVIYDQAPVEGTLMPNKGTVILFVSKGPAKIVMPNLIGLDIEAAMTVLYNMGKEFDVSLPMEVYDIYSPSTQAGLIARTAPGAGEDFYPEKGTIQVYIAMEDNVSESVDITNSRSSSSEKEE